MTCMGVGVGVSVGVAVGVAVGVRVGVDVSVGTGVGVAKMGALHASTISTHGPMTIAALFRFMGFSFLELVARTQIRTSREGRLIARSAQCAPWHSRSITPKANPLLSDPDAQARLADFSRAPILTHSRSRGQAPSWPGALPDFAGLCIQ
jgi:hypothetical protein